MVVAKGGVGIFSFLIVILNDFFVLIYNVLGSQELDMRARGRRLDNTMTRFYMSRNM